MSNASKQHGKDGISSPIISASGAKGALKGAAVIASADLMTPEPTDAFWPKLAVEAAVVGLAAALEVSQSKTDDKPCISGNCCPPCSPYPKGTVGYQGPKTSVNGIHGTRNGTGEPHYIIFEVHQRQDTCKCRWQETKKLFGHHYLGEPKPGWINLNGKPRPPPYP